MISLTSANDLINENYLWKDGLHLTNEGSSLLLKTFINYLNGNENNSIWLMTKSCDMEKNIEIKKNQVLVTKERCSTSQKLISNSNNSSKSNTECITELKKFRINNIKNVICKFSCVKIWWT